MFISFYVVQHFAIYSLQNHIANDYGLTLHK